MKVSRTVLTAAVAAQQSGFFYAEIKPLSVAQEKGDPIAVAKGPTSA